MEYIGIGPEKGKTVLGEDALFYAMEHCGIAKIKESPDWDEFSQMLVDWFFSGNWIKEELVGETVS